ncbi:nicotianamine synthase family protein [Paenibacillus chartarius]|uniref:Nicotianamine synthase family protein n=1 Tax=Paenibacillus chartarius TaxID=747481 RepID=A0ABV6DPF5_9BACL
METYSTDIPNSCLPAPGSRISTLAAVIQETYAVLRQAADLSPANPAVTEQIGLLAQQIRLPYSPEEVQYILQHEEIQPLRQILLGMLSEAECRMELFDSHQLSLQANGGLSCLRHYRNWETYEHLVRLEREQLRRLRRTDGNDNTVVFVGSGPMPISAMMIHLEEQVNVVCVDMNPDACEAARTLLERVGLGDPVRVVQAEGANYDYAGCGIVFVASLVSGKAKVFEQIRATNPNALVAVRTAEGMRQLMYEAVDESVMETEGWRLLARTSPIHSHAINSTLFYRYDGSGRVQ